MSRLHYFFVEERVGPSRWRCLPSLLRSTRQLTYAEALFTVTPRSPLAALFFSPNALLALHSGCPEEPCSEPVARRLNEGGSGCYWIALEALLFEY